MDIWITVRTLALGAVGGGLAWALTMQFLWFASGGRGFFLLSK